jgi:hypothetical protein
VGRRENMRRTTITLLILLVGLAAPAAFAGRIFGDIKLDGKPVPAGIKVMIALVPPVGPPGSELKPKPIAADSTVTDKFGSYKLTVKQEGKCILTVLYEKQAPTIEAFSYQDATRYDLILERKDDMLSLRRK